MTNEQIAKVMGWRIDSSKNFFGCIFNSANKFIGTVDEMGTDTPLGFQLAKLLQVKMVEDGWNVSIHNWKEKFTEFPPKVYFSVEAFNFDISSKHIFKDADTESQALVALFKKIYGVKRG